MAAAVHPIDVVEAAYELERTDADWLRNLAEIVSPLIDGGRGLAACGGRRYIVAHRNTQALPDPRALTERGRTTTHLAALGKANKLIAYELGLGESMVATHLAAALRKLGAKSWGGRCVVPFHRHMTDRRDGGLVDLGAAYVGR